MVHPASYFMTHALRNQPGPSSSRQQSSEQNATSGNADHHVDASPPSASSARSLQQPLLRRLNGRPQACDACRYRKVSCDHAHPMCRRCQKRNEQCVYTISEQTASASTPRRRRRPGSKSGSTPRQPATAPERVRRRDRLSTSSADELTTASPAGAVPPSAASQHTGINVRPSLSSPPERPTPRTRNHIPLSEGYLGFTSYSNVFDEARNTLSLLNSGYPEGPQSNEATTTSKNNPTPASASSSIHQTSAAATDPLPPATRDVCLHVLRSIPDPSYPALGTPRKPAQLWSRLAVERIMATLKRKYGSDLGPTRRDAKLERIAREICANSSKPFDSDLADPTAFLNQFAGDDLRWESLGLLFTFREYSPDVNGSGASAAPPPRGWDKRVSHQLWSESARQCLRLCLVLAKTFSDGNSIIMFLCIRQMVVDSLVYGDASLDCWLSHGAAVAIATFLGLHALPDSSVHKPSLASELKRRFFANIFTLDKVASSFHGRPPLLGHRYVTSPSPLDLPDEALIAGGEVLEQAVANLDDDGWSRSGKMESATLPRCRFMLATIKDELMEIALGNAKHAPLAVITEIKQREQRIFDSFPPWCKYHDDDLKDLALSIDVLFSRLLLLLEHLQSCLIAERFIGRHNGPDDGSLLFISFEMVRHVLVLWLHVDRFEGGWEGQRVDFLWMVMTFGAPAGGVLCMELLYPTLPNRPIPYTSPETPRITRSAIIQQLSLLVGFLGWVAPTAPTSEHTANCRRVIQSVLDYTLNGNNVPSRPGQQAMDSMGFLEGLETGDLNFGFDMWGTFDWYRPEEAMPGFA